MIMASKKFPALFLCFLLFSGVFLTAPWPVSAKSGLNPCHKNKETLGRGVTCEGVELPHDLCSSCKLKDFEGNTGAFKDCASIYNLYDGKCQNSLKRYAKLNKCDWIRNKQVADFSNAANRQGLDYFVYAICEECCDCVPRGAKPSDYDQRARENRLLSARRGNCPAHARFDICKVLPKVRFFKPEGSASPQGFPYACPMLEEWYRKDSSNWLQKSWVPMTYQLERFLQTSYRAMKCSARETWQRCAALESAQNRL